MKKKIKIIVANPAGNITIFVKDHFERNQYINVSKQLLDNDSIKAEQVAFILKSPKTHLSKGAMEMSGLEFCGNASRSFGLIMAKELNLYGKNKIMLDVSGSKEPVEVEVDISNSYTKIKMPNPKTNNILKIEDLKIINTENNFIDEIGIVDFEGILHVILKDVKDIKDSFKLMKKYIYTKFNPPALGVMFWNTKEESLIPVVYVNDIDTTYFEGSCCSGTAACAFNFSLKKEDGIYKYTFPQPSGILESTVKITDEEAKEVYIEGPVHISEEFEFEIEI